MPEETKTSSLTDKRTDRSAQGFGAMTEKALSWVCLPKHQQMLTQSLTAGFPFKKRHPVLCAHKETPKPVESNILLCVCSPEALCTVSLSSFILHSFQEAP
uniref:Uncharacterized protein n=1 Tax=Sphaerodactylus townsendi TaxID=933632 RepID=A0ACB8ETE4_9SAUR